jgi:diaminopimelate epimerase
MRPPLPAPLPFLKVHGLGNDFVLLDGLSRELPLDRLLEPAVATWICDRHLGVGADGVLLLLPPRSPEAQLTMRILNADGSEAEMCGNGIRCAAKAAREHLPGFSGLERIRFDTGAGLLECDLRLASDGSVEAVRVDMGRPRLERAEIPMRGEGRFVESTISALGRELRSTAVSMGNPHLVTFVDEDPRALAETLGPTLEHHPEFPRRTNVEFARLEPEGLELWVWERGCGITRACGTGACATAVAAVVTGRHREGAPLAVRLPGGTLRIEVTPGLERVLMEGPAVEVFRGELWPWS